MKLTPVLLVEQIESCLPFWVERMGWQKTIEVPGETGIAFAILVNDGVELMLQTIASVEKDTPVFSCHPGHCRTSLFIEVSDFADTLRRLEGYPIAMPERTTFYGMREIGAFDPAGNVVVFGFSNDQPASA